jgi:hypothetical protein
VRDKPYQICVGNWKYQCKIDVADGKGQCTQGDADCHSLQGGVETNGNRIHAVTDKDGRPAIGPFPAKVIMTVELKPTGGQCMEGTKVSLLKTENGRILVRYWSLEIGESGSNAVNIPLYYIHGGISDKINAGPLQKTVSSFQSVFF